LIPEIQVLSMCWLRPIIRKAEAETDGMLAKIAQLHIPTITTHAGKEPAAGPTGYGPLTGASNP
jgi:hypothetical protein